MSLKVVSILNEMEKSCFHRDDDDVFRNGCGGEGEEKDETESKVWAMTSDVYTRFLLFTPNEIVKQKLHSKWTICALLIDIIHIMLMLFVFNTPQNQDFPNYYSVYDFGLFLYTFGLRRMPIHVSLTVSKLNVYFMSIYISLKLNYRFCGFRRNSIIFFCFFFSLSFRLYKNKHDIAKTCDSDEKI